MFNLLNIWQPIMLPPENFQGILLPNKLYDKTLSKTRFTFSGHPRYSGMSSTYTYTPPWTRMAVDSDGHGLGWQWTRMAVDSDGLKQRPRSLLPLSSAVSLGRLPHRSYTGRSRRILRRVEGFSRFCQVSAHNKFWSSL